MPVAAALSVELGREGAWTDWRPGPEKSLVRARMEEDILLTPWEQVGRGRVVWARYQEARPEGFSENALVLAGSHSTGDHWWDPPVSALPGTPNHGRVRSYIEGFLRGEWYYATVTVEREEEACCSECGKPRKSVASCAGVESCSPPEYFAEVIASLLHELSPSPAPRRTGEEKDT